MVTEQEKLIQAAVTKFREGTSYRWEFALLAERIVGRSKELGIGVVQEVADRIGIGRSQVENYARAGLMYLTLKEHFENTTEDVEYIKQVMPISHWTTLADAWKILEFDLREAFELFLEIARSDKKPKVEEWKNMLYGHFGEGGKMDWETHNTQATRALNKLVNDYQVPEGLRLRAKDFIAAQVNASRTLVIPGNWPAEYTANAITNKKGGYLIREAMRNIKAMVRAHMDPSEQGPVAVPCDIYITFYDQPYDTGNIPQKQMIDMLIGYWIPDDSKKIVPRVILASSPDSKNPRVEITAVPVAGAKLWQMEDKTNSQDMEV